jgi:hypothetical protein
VSILFFIIHLFVRKWLALMARANFTMTRCLPPVDRIGQAASKVVPQANRMVGLLCVSRYRWDDPLPTLEPPPYPHRSAGLDRAISEMESGPAGGQLGAAEVDRLGWITCKCGHLERRSGQKGEKALEWIRKPPSLTLWFCLISRGAGCSTDNRATKTRQHLRSPKCSEDLFIERRGGS